MTHAPFEHLLIIGAGLIGSSVARAARAKNTALKVSVLDHDPKIVAEAEAIGFADHVTNDPAVAASADLIIFAVPVGAMTSAAFAVSDHVQPGTIISDVGSVKASVRNALTEALPSHAHIIPGHPVAGTEQSGPDAGFSTLFEGRWCILTPDENTDEDALMHLTWFWEQLGSTVEVMTPEHHDLVLAITSHVPHLIAYNIVGTANDMETVTRSEIIKYSAGGFRDFTRIAASDPTMWRDVFLNNKDAVLEMLGRFSEDLTALQRAIRWGDGDALFELFTRTREIRRRIIDAGQDDPAADFGRPHGEED